MTDITIPAELRHWADHIGCAVTVCDADLKIIYMNERSRLTFARHGDIIGHDLMQYHPPHARQKITEMLTQDVTNAYTIRKNSQLKLIYQTPWHIDGKVAGLVELSMPLPDEMPHYDRDQAQK